jgi:hypothetical protein
MRLIRREEEVSNSVVDRHRFGADLDPDLTLHFDADLNPHPTPSFTHVGKSGLLFT